MVRVLRTTGLRPGVIRIPVTMSVIRAICAIERRARTKGNGLAWHLDGGLVYVAPIAYGDDRP